MKTNVFLVAILSLGSIFTSCEKERFDVFPSSKVTTINFSASNVSELYVSDVFNVYVNFSETEESVQIEANENLHHLIEMSQSGNQLVVGLEKNSRISGDPVLNVYIKTAKLSKVKAEGAAAVQFENPLQTTQFDAEIEGASKISGNIQVDKLIASLTGASILDISGESDSFEIDVEGASEMTGFNFQTKFLKAYLNGASSISLTVNEKLDINAKGASKVFYKGSGTVENQNLSDASEVVKMD